MDCGVPSLKGHQYGNKVKCAECHSSYRFCRDNVPDWSNLSSDERRQWILKNKGQGGRGKKRILQRIDEDPSLNSELNCKVVCRFCWACLHYPQFQIIPKPRWWSKTIPGMDPRFHSWMKYGYLVYFRVQCHCQLWCSSVQDLVLLVGWFLLLVCRLYSRKCQVQEEAEEAVQFWPTTLPGRMGQSSEGPKGQEGYRCFWLRYGGQTVYSSYWPRASGEQYFQGNRIASTSNQWSRGFG